MTVRSYQVPPPEGKHRTPGCSGVAGGAHSRATGATNWGQGDPMDCNLPGSSVHGISQARILEWVAISFSRGIFPTQGSNPSLLLWQADSLPLSHQGSP